MPLLLWLVWRERIVAGDPHPENLLLCADGRVCLLDFELLRDVETRNLDGERGVMPAIVDADPDADPDAVHGTLTQLGYLSGDEPYDDDALLEHLATAGEWFLADDFRRIDRGYVGRTLESSYPPRSPWLSAMQRMALPASTLLLRRMEVQMRCWGNWARAELGGDLRRALGGSAVDELAGPAGHGLLQAAQQLKLADRVGSPAGRLNGVQRHAGSAIARPAIGVS